MIIKKLILEYEMHHEDFWITMERYSCESVLKIIDILKYGLRSKHCEDDDYRYIVQQACATAFYILSQSTPSLQNAAFELAVELVQLETAKKAENVERVSFIRDLYLWSLSHGDDAKISCVVSAIKRQTQLSGQIIDSAVYDIYDGEINRAPEVITRMLYYLRSDQLLLEMQTELYELFSLIEVSGSILDDVMTRELFRVYMKAKPLIMIIRKADDE